MHTVVETSSYLRDADDVGMSEAERTLVVDTVAADPQGGISLGGGLFKRRIAGRGKGKSGGYRIVVIFLHARLPAYLVAALSKGQAGNFSKAEQKQFAAVAHAIKAALE